MTTLSGGSGSGPCARPLLRGLGRSLLSSSSSFEACPRFLGADALAGLSSSAAAGAWVAALLFCRGALALGAALRFGAGFLGALAIKNKE